MNGPQSTGLQVDRIRNHVHSFENQKVVITGGGGFFGMHLGRMLYSLGADVLLVDIRPPIQDVNDGIKFIQGDVRDRNFIFQVCRGASCVFHLASYGMSGKEQLRGNEFIESVNVGSTQSMIDACCELGISRLVYTSTLNVIFGGQDIRNGDETLPILPLDKHKDHYSRTKSMAEQLVIKANGKAIKGGKKLCTCAIRPPGIYGVGETRHLPRIVEMMEAGLTMFKIGGPDILIEWVHVDNLAAGHVLAADRLSESKQHIAAGEVYFISDGKPVNQFEWLRPLYHGLGISFPSLSVPYIVMYYVGLLVEWVHFIVKPFYNFQPLITRTELFQVAVTHYFNLEKASRHLGYEPIDHDIADIVEHFQKLKLKRKRRQPSAVSYWLINFVIAAMFAVMLLSFLPMVTT
ncbi:short-chain dehydrogenase/reductase family 42E member 1-like [Ptychodera flava]|uniref:short-chain dehydrogenase/reductase family 42E member 1-like n=1 Tax=Ptychodera flava TaxID=63121 RepID=UPI00396A7FCA